MSAASKAPVSPPTRRLVPIAAVAAACLFAISALLAYHLAAPSEPHLDGFPQPVLEDTNVDRTLYLGVVGNAPRGAAVDWTATCTGEEGWTETVGLVVVPTGGTSRVLPIEVDVAAGGSQTGRCSIDGLTAGDIASVDTAPGAFAVAYGEAAEEAIEGDGRAGA